MSKPIVGLAGGIGAGKSAVATILEDLGAGVIDSDALARDEIARPAVRSTLRQWWGDQVFDASGAVDRRKLAAIVFLDPEQRRRLEAILHPRIAARRDEIVAQFDRAPAVRMIVIDAPLLYEAGLDQGCDAVIFVDAERAVRQARVADTRNWSEQELDQREKNQLALDTKRARADYICENNSSLDDLRRRVEEIFNQVVAKPARVDPLSPR